MVKYKTEQRKLMQDFFADHPHEMFSAKDIFEVLGKETISISAVYRNLSELETYGLVRRCTKNGIREAFYQYTGIEDCKEHIHMTCKKCGKTIHMALDDTDELVRNASKYKNFAVDRTATVLLESAELAETLKKGVRKMTKKRLIATLLTVMVIFFVLFSSLFIVENANHDCIGDDCPICYAISVCENVLKTIGLASTVAVLASFVGTFMLFLPSLTESGRQYFPRYTQGETFELNKN